MEEFTDEIEDREKKLNELSFQDFENWDERLAKQQNSVCCHDCRWFLLGIMTRCSDVVGKYHKPCGDFEWW